MKKSRRAQRMDQQNDRARRSPAFNLVALMDIFTILVFFLLVNSSDVQEMSSPKSVDLPESIADTAPHDTPTVLVTARDIQVDGKSVAQVEPLLSDDALIIQSLRQALAGGGEGADKADRGEITILGDRTIPYQVLKKVMATCTEAGFGRVSLAVMQKTANGG
jgi:biopolymer transport protein TolR